MQIVILRPNFFIGAKSYLLIVVLHYFLQQEENKILDFTTWCAAMSIWQLYLVHVVKGFVDM